MGGNPSEYSVAVAYISNDYSLKSQHLYYAQVIEKLEANSYREVNKFVKLVNKRNAISALYPTVIQLLKDFAGNFTITEL